MIYKDIFVLSYFLLSKLYNVDGKVMSSLVFVIDDTGSMSDEIAQVKDRTYEVFDAVLSSNGSSIDEFILVTFNDPGTKLRCITKDKNVYRNAVNNISVYGGDDCAEFAMAGIELGLEKSKPNSFLYVFTDASAKDYDKYERVKSLSLKKSTQVTFLLTGDCNGQSTPNYLVYEGLSNATSGQVFNMLKDNVHEVINYIIESIKYTRTTLKQKIFQNRSEKSVIFVVDSKIWDVMISVAGTSSTVRVLDSNNTEVKINEVVKIEKTHVVKFDTQPGVYTAIISSTGPVSVLITGSTTVTFQHGFSVVEPTTFNETSTKPISDQHSFLSIQLDNIKRDVLLKTVELRDENDNLLQELLLIMIDEEEQLYRTSNSFIPPNFSFNIVIRGYTLSDELITRLSSTSIECQKPELEVTQPLSPIVTILAENIIDAQYNKPLTVKCKVKGYPKPNVTWIDDSGNETPTMVKVIDLPYDYISILEINNLKKNATFTCHAVNTIGDDSKTIRAKINTYFKVLGLPPDMVIEYRKTEVLNFIIDAVPPPVILWYKNNKTIIENEHFLLNENNKSLTIRDMQPNLIGSYSVEAFNGFNRQMFYFEVSISGVAPPTITNVLKDKTITAVEGDLATRIPCRATGSPRPTVTWLMNGLNIDLSSESYKIEEDGSLVIKYINVTAAGNYICKAENILGTAYEDFNVLVTKFNVNPIGNPPTILVEQGSSVHVDCDLPQMKSDQLRWFKNGRFIKNGDLYLIQVDIMDAGLYSCRVSNFVSSASSHKNVKVGTKPTFSSEEETEIDFNLGTIIVMICSAVAYPMPTALWWKNGEIIENKSMVHIIYTKDYNDIGKYTCNVNNVFGTISRTFHVKSKDCSLNINYQLKGRQPLMKSMENQWLTSSSINGSLRIPRSYRIQLVCPNSNITARGFKYGQQVIATCEEGSIFNINGEFVDFSEIKCDKKNQLLTRRTRMACAVGNNELINVGFDLGDQFLTIYDVCLSKDYKYPVYTRHDMYPLLENSVPENKIRFQNIINLPYNYDEMYDCPLQRLNILVTHRRSLSQDKCCFSKRQLVNPKDVSAGLAQLATYDYLNVIPQWSSCGTENWDKVEENVRKLVKSVKKPLEVWTGSAESTKIPEHSNFLQLTDRHNNVLPTPKYIWKVISNHEEGKSLAVIHINVPDISHDQASSLVVCKDICNEVEWMRDPEWRNVSKGFTFCCEVDEFASAFGYENIF